MIRFCDILDVKTSICRLLLWLPLIFGIYTAAEARKIHYLETDLVEDGEAISLEVVLFKPVRNGPFPLLIFNHGSTGYGKNSMRIKQTFWTNAVAEFFNDRGWMVAFPQRRGRGRSGGLYDEGFNKDRSQGYSCLAEFSLPGADRALEYIFAALKTLIKNPEVDSNNIIIGGVSCGGALSVAYAGLHPNQVIGVINFVGGWMTNKCPGGPSINRTVFLQGAAYGRPMLWLYGKGGPFYSTAHTRWAFENFVGNGGSGRYLLFDVPEANGHRLYRYKAVWGEAVDQYLAEVYAEPAHLPEKRGVLKRGVLKREKVISPHNDVPLPEDLTITKPDTKLSNKQKMFSGLWTGASDESWNHVLVVEALDEIGGQVVFALGINKSIGFEQGQWVRLEAVWDETALVVLLSGGRKAIYRLVEPNHMELKFFDGASQQTDHAWLTRSPPLAKMSD